LAVQTVAWHTPDVQRPDLQSVFAVQGVHTPAWQRLVMQSVSVAQLPPAGTECGVAQIPTLQ
jgi:hypothetical protein